MKKTLKLCSLVLAVVMMLLMIASCGETNTPATPSGYTITINWGLYADSDEFDADEEITLDAGEKIAAAVKEIVKEVSFDGYKADTTFYLDEEFDEKLKSSTKATEDLEVFVRWISANHTVTINWNGGDGDDTIQVADGESLKSALEAQSDDATPPTGKVFGGWYLDSGFGEKVGSTLKCTEDVEVFAKWNADTSAADKSCMEGGEKHTYGTWQTVNASCTQEGGQKRVCALCGYELFEKKAEKLTHQYESTFGADGAKQVCSLCDDTITTKYTNVANKAKTFEFEDASRLYGGSSIGTLYNGNWRDQAIAPKGSGDIVINIAYENAVRIDAVVVGVNGSGGFKVEVIYDDSSEFEMVGSVAFGGGSNAEEIKANATYLELDNTRKVLELKLTQANPAQGTDYYQEIQLLQKPN